MWYSCSGLSVSYSRTPSIRSSGTGVHFHRNIQKSKNLSQEALAEKLGVCKKTIIDIEKNTGNPKFELLCMLVRELDLPLYEVFYPEVSESSEMKNVLIKELSDCSDYEMKVILSVVKSLRYT